MKKLGWEGDENLGYIGLWRDFYFHSVVKYCFAALGAPRILNIIPNSRQFIKSIYIRFNQVYCNPAKI